MNHSKQYQYYKTIGNTSDSFFLYCCIQQLVQESKYLKNVRIVSQLQIHFITGASNIYKLTDISYFFYYFRISSRAAYYPRKT